MMRRIAVVGNSLNSGGYILPYEQPPNNIFTYHGHKTALIGGLAYCDTCRQTGTIAKAGGPYRPGYMGTRQVALDGAILSCAPAPLIPPLTPRFPGNHGAKTRIRDMAELQPIFIIPQIITRMIHTTSGSS